MLLLEEVGDAVGLEAKGNMAEAGEAVVKAPKLGRRAYPGADERADHGGRHVQLRPSREGQSTMFQWVNGRCIRFIRVLRQKRPWNLE